MLFATERQQNMGSKLNEQFNSSLNVTLLFFIFNCGVLMNSSRCLWGSDLHVLAHVTHFKWAAGILVRLSFLERSISNRGSNEAKQQKRGAYLDSGCCIHGIDAYCLYKHTAWINMNILNFCFHVPVLTCFVFVNVAVASHENVWIIFSYFTPKCN